MTRQDRDRFEREIRCLVSTCSSVDAVAEMLKERNLGLTGITLVGRYPDTQVVVTWRDRLDRGAEGSRGVRIWPLPDDGEHLEDPTNFGGHALDWVMEYLDTGV